MKIEEKAQCLREVLMDVFRGRIDSCPIGWEGNMFAAAYWVVGAMRWPEFVIMRWSDIGNAKIGQYDYCPFVDTNGMVGEVVGYLFGLPVKMDHGDRILLVTGEPPR